MAPTHRSNPARANPARSGVAHALGLARRRLVLAVPLAVGLTVISVFLLNAVAGGVGA